jgi:uncharacterized protein (DUF302 family)
MSYALSTELPLPFGAALAATRDALAGQGFGILTEIDLRTTLKAKLDVEIPPQVILGACRPPLAYAALQAEPAVGLLLPCNVVVRAIDDNRTLVESLDPQTLVGLTGNDGLIPVADDARGRLSTVLAHLAAVPD